MKTIAIILTIFGAMAVMVPTSYAGVGVNINIGVPPPPPVVPPPPPVAVQAPPDMVMMPENGVYVAVGISYDLFFFGGRYYYFHNGYWYGARGYGGPWVHVERGALPVGLRRYKIERLHAFRDHAWNEYRGRGEAYQGRHFRGVERESGKERNVRER